MTRDDLAPDAATPAETGSGVRVPDAIPPVPLPAGVSQPARSNWQDARVPGAGNAVQAPAGVPASDVRAWLPWVTLVTDVVLINVAFLIAYWLRYDLQLFRSVDPANNVPYTVYLPMVAILTVLLVLTNRREGAYDVRKGRPLFDDLYGLLNATTTAIMIMVVVVFFYRRLFYSRFIFIYAGILIIFLLGLARRGAQHDAGPPARLG